MDPLASLTEEGRIVLQGTYRLERPIGRGAMGVIYEASHARLPGRFAVKILTPSLASNADAFSRFCREAEIMSELRHPNAVRIFDFNVTPEGLPYFVMERLDGADLEARLHATGPLPLTQVIAIVTQVASALGAAHQRGIVHRDLKPSNIFLVEVEGEDMQFVKVLDFGVSITTAPGRMEPHQAGDGAEIIGTPRYMAPEQALGQTDRVDARADQFALAAITYEMLTGVSPFDGESLPALLERIVHQRPEPLSRHLAWDCAGIEEVLDRALAKDPAARFETIGGFAAALAVAANQVLCAVPAETPAPAPSAAGAESPAVVTEGPSGIYDELDWDSSSSDLRIPISPWRAVLLAGVAAGLIALVMAKGWASEIPEDATMAYRYAVAWARRTPPLPQPPPAPVPPKVQPKVQPKIEAMPPPEPPMYGPEYRPPPVYGPEYRPELLQP